MAAKRRFKCGNNGEFYLPMEMIQHIQLFLNAKDAAQTTVLSKLWYRAWLTRPSIDLDEWQFSTPFLPNSDLFGKFAMKMVLRYQDTNLTVDSFKLQLKRRYVGSLLNGLIKKVGELGVKEMTILHESWPFNLPYCVFQANTLVRLTLGQCWIDAPPPGTVNIPRVKFLTFQGNDLKDDCYTHMFPCLEDLTLKNCKVVDSIHISSNSIKHISMEFVSKFKGKFEVPNIQKFKLVVECYPTGFPVLSLSSSSSEWESDITFIPKKCSLGPSWPNILKRFLNNFCGAKISLSLEFRDRVVCKYNGDIKGKRGPTVENMKLFMYLFPEESPHLLAGLIWFSRPKFITLLQNSGSSISKEEGVNDLNRFLSQELMQDDGSCRSKIQNLFHNRGLVEVSLEYFDINRGEWHLMASVSTLRSLQILRRVRFRLAWCHE